MCRFCKRNIDRAKRGCLNREAASIFASEPSQQWFGSCASISAVLGIRVHPKAATVRQRDQSNLRRHWPKELLRPAEFHRLTLSAVASSPQLAAELIYHIEIPRENP